MTVTQETRDIIRQGTNLIFSFAQFLVTLLPVAGFGTGIGSQSAGGVPPVQPIYWSFFIWFLIYAGCIAYGIYQALPAHREDEILRRVGFYTSSAFIGVTTYALVAQFEIGSEWILIAIFIWILASLLVAIMRLTVDQSHLTRTEEYTILAPVSLLLGWCSLAVFVNIAAIFKDSGMLQATIETSFSLLLLLVAGSIAAGIISITKGNIWYTIPVIWGLIGVVIANIWQQPNITVAGGASLAAIVLVGILVIVRRTDQEKSGRNGGYL
jgi:hypothetical protein